MTLKYGLWYLVRVRYRARGKLFLSLLNLKSRGDKRRGRDCLKGGLSLSSLVIATFPLVTSNCVLN